MKQSARLSAGTRTQMDRADRRFETLRRLSAESATFMQAMDAVGMSYDGVRGLLYRRTGSTVWPIKERV